MSENKRNIIFSLYAHILLAIGVGIVATGIYMLLSNFTNRWLIDRYPLGYDENRCNYSESDITSRLLTEARVLTYEQLQGERARLEAENRRAQLECQEKLEQERLRRKNSDFAAAVNTLVVGLLILAPHGWMVARLNRKV